MATVRVRKRGKTYSYIFEAGKTADGKRRVIEKGGFALKDDAYAACQQLLLHRLPRRALSNFKKKFFL